ncbi:ABC transporter permease [Limibacillus sp. MBR-115]|jgi:peptide/nickel transport system permease protein|uniref:ABC transporter permease n=1 Tax=Limibacillus sp. MBR-115 TaxID=3156465 RepID=UPI003396F002
MLLSYFLNRLIVAALMALAATVVIFLITHMVPTDPIRAMLGDLAASNPTTVARFRTQWGLDLPLHEQYFLFLKGLFQGDLGISIKTRRGVVDDILQYAPASIELATAAALITIIIGVPFGIIASVFRDRFVDHFARIISLIGVAAPTFWLAFLALALFYGGLKIAPSPGRLGITDIAPPTVTGMFTIDSIIAGDWDTFRAALAHLIMPATVLAASTLGLITRTMRSSMLETLGQDYVRVARAKGLTEPQVVVTHAVPNALIPVVTLGGLAYAELLAGTVMTETIFAWPGLGRYTYQSATSLDFPAIMGITLVVAIVYLIMNIIVDMSYALLDPRVGRR